MAPPSHPPRSLGQNMVRVAGIFQGLIALPIMLCMGWSVFEYLYDTYYTWTLYYFIKYLFNALFAAVILFVLIVQRWGPQAAITKSANVWFEIMKSGAATAIWIWLVAKPTSQTHNINPNPQEAITGPPRRFPHDNPPGPRGPVIEMALMSSVALICIFYPTLAFVVYDAKNASGDSDEERRAADEEETENLLGE
ncbi:hypothetical protein CJF32_00003073 [Rutstroemia sp. NJR-2017a WRK4]|nr:hypothetical protein CJF32_00003073 [Rutstroemia sp. NJR-2017a WRK4]